MNKQAVKRTIDMQILADWVEPRSKVLDLGCGRGVLLEYLVQTKSVSAIGVDLDINKIAACVPRGIDAYQGDMLAFMRSFPDRHFDRVICSRTIEEMQQPEAVITEALRVGRSVAVGFVNHGYYKNRLAHLLSGRKPLNQVYTTAWHKSRPSNPATLADFEQFCSEAGIRILRHVHLRGDWHRPARFLPNLFAGYALYDITRA